jgi:hypothetical protein
VAGGPPGTSSGALTPSRSHSADAALVVFGDAPVFRGLSRTSYPGRSAAETWYSSVHCWHWNLCGVQKWTPVGLQKGRPDGVDSRKCLRNLVGLPGFEPGTSCTPNTLHYCIDSTQSGVFYDLHELGASAFAHRRWLYKELFAHLLTQPVQRLRRPLS